MNRRSGLFSLLLVPALAFASAAAALARPSASGEVNLTIFGGLQTYSFNAVQHADGRVTGHFQLKSRGQDVTIFGQVNCLNIVGNTATISGVVTDSNPPEFEGWTFMIVVVDNGEGANAPSDLATDGFGFPPGDPTDCHTGPPFEVTLRINEAGNIQVNP